MSRSTTPTVMETQDPEPMDVQDSPEMEQTNQTAEPSDTKSKPKRPRAPETLTREAGKSLLPHSRVQKILKADKVLLCHYTPLQKPSSDHLDSSRLVFHPRNIYVMCICGWMPVAPPGTHNGPTRSSVSHCARNRRVCGSALRGCTAGSGARTADDGTGQGSRCVLCSVVGPQLRYPGTYRLHCILPVHF